MTSYLRLTKEFGCTKHLPYVFLFLLLLLVHSNMGICSDDIVNQHRLDDQSLFAFIAHDYQHWSSRFLLNSLIAVLSRCNLWIWRIMDSAVFVLIAFMINKLFVRKYDFISNSIICTSILLFPIFMLESAGWIATTISYVWPVAFGLVAFLPFTWKRIRIPYCYLLLIPLCFAANAEQMCCVLLALAIIISGYKFLNKEKFPLIYAFLCFTICSLFLLSSLTCPGNQVRTIAETAHLFPTFPELNVFQKIALGLASTYNKLFAFDILYAFFSATIVFAAIVKRKNFVLPLIQFMIVVIYNIYMFFFTGTSAFSLITGYKFDIPVPESFAFSILITLSILVTIISAWCVWLHLNRQYFPPLLFLAGLCSRLIMSFSPTLFASGFRTMSIFYFTLIIIVLLLINDIGRYSSMLQKKWFYTFFFFSVFVNLTIYYIIFCYFPNSTV